MTVRPLTAQDFDDAYALYKDLVGDIPVPNGQDGKAQFEAILAHPGSWVLGAERDGRIISMVTLHILPNMTFGGRPYALIENVVTARAAQGQGYGRLTMQSAIDKAWSEGVYKIMLLTGRTLGARGFYERLGFNTTDKHGMILRRAPQRNP